MAMNAETFSTGASLAASTSYGVTFPFRATEVTVVNDGAVDLYVSLQSTTATTGDWYLRSGESQTWRHLISALGMIATATSCARVGAWRS